MRSAASVSDSSALSVSSMTRRSALSPQRHENAGASLAAEAAASAPSRLSLAAAWTLAGSADEAAAADLAAQAGRALAGVAYAPVAVVVSAYARADVAHSLTGFGFLVPKVEHRALLGTLFSSSMFDGRAPEGAVLGGELPVRLDR